VEALVASAHGTAQDTTDRVGEAALADRGRNFLARSPMWGR